MSSKLLRNGTVLEYDDRTEAIKVRRGASIWLQNGTIEAIVDSPDDLALPTNTEIVDITGKIISPGFINTHIHAWMAAYRTLAPNITLPHYFVWLSQLSEAAFKFGPEDVYFSALEGYLEGLNSGVTTFLDHAHHNWRRDVVRPGYEAAVDSGARIWWCYDPTPSAKFPAEEHWKALEEDVVRSPETALVTQGLAWDGLCYASAEELTKAKGMIKKLDVQHVTVHHLGGPWPSPMSPPAVFSKKPALQELGIPVTYSHSSFLTPEDISALREHNSHISITPESEFHYGHGQATGHLISDQASIGVDTQFTFSGDLLTQTRMWLQAARNTLYRQCTDGGCMPRDVPMSVEDAFLLATRQGGRALHRDDIGVLRVGAKADLVVFNGDSPNMLGWHDPIAAVVLHANTSDVEHVLVDGEFRKRDFKLLGKKHEWEDVKREFLKCCERIQPFAMKPPPQPDNMFGHGKMGDVEVVTLKKTAN